MIEKIRACFLIAALAAAGCSASGVVVVTVTADGDLSGIDHLHVVAENGGQTAQAIDVAPATRPFTFSLRFAGDRSGPLTVTVAAVDAGGATLASAQGTGEVDPGKQTSVTVTLPARVLTDGGVPDLATPDLAQPVLPDLEGIDF